MSISRDTLKNILSDGRKINSDKYRKECVRNHLKTFFFFCVRLSCEPKNTTLASSTLNEFIVSELRKRHIEITNKFNPEGWFGKAWTEWRDKTKNQTNFRNEYLDVLERIGDEPYSYRIKPECFDVVKEIVGEFDNRSGTK